MKKDKESKERNMTENIKSLIAQVIRINEKYNAIKRLNGENFNIFSILNMERNEVETHSKFIYELLNPLGTHNQGYLFLNLFIFNVLKLKDEQVIKNVKREDLTSKKRRIDFTIETEQYQIGIEMKIDAYDQKVQLLDYDKELKNRCSNSQKSRLYYLTLTGYEADSSSTNNKLVAKKDYDLISFEFDILNWIELCIEKSATIPTLREGLVHYRNLLRKITNKLPHTMEQDMENLIRGSKDIEAMQTIVDSYPKIWAKKEMEFWDKVWKNIEEKCDKYGFDFIDYYDIWADEEGNEYKDNEIIQNIMDIRNKKYGIVGFRLDKTYSNDTFLGIYINEWNNTISFYIEFLDKNENSIMNNKLETICKEIKFNRKDGQTRYKYINEQITFYGRYQTNPTYKLFDDIEFKNYIKIAKDEIIEIIEQLNKKEEEIIQAINNKK